MNIMIYGEERYNNHFIVLNCRCDDLVLNYYKCTNYLEKYVPI